MGVMATYCQLCGLPTQHDHYVQAARGDLPGPPGYKIYRDPGSQTWERGERPFRFEKHHDWLCDAVAIMYDDRRVLRGRIRDGALVSSDGGEEQWVGEGNDDGSVYHHVCWERLGCPKPDRFRASTNGSYELSFIALYQGQLFDFHELRDDGLGWMLEDPRESARTAEHLDKLRDVARAEDLRRDSGRGGSWRSACEREDNHGRVMIGRTRSLSEAERSEFPHAVWFDKMVEPSPYLRPELEALERRVKEIIERDGRAVLVTASHGVDRMLLTWYAKDGESSLQAIEALPKLDIVVDSAHGTRVDPEWTLYEERQLAR